jgi:hypothetical protein
MSASPITLIAERADSFGANALEVAAGHAMFDFPVLRADGARLVYRIKAVADGDIVTAAEPVQDKLPSFCPERHINTDGTFCLGWSGHTSLSVKDEESATLWWGRLLRFLTYQKMASRSGVWPLDDAWAHGAAAVHQSAAETAAAALGEDFSSDLQKRKFKTKWSKTTGPNGRALRILRNGRHIYSIWTNPPRLINKQQACVCSRVDIKRHRRLRNCLDHSDAALTLGVSLLNWERAERQFWESHKNKPCCGTMKNCPLNTEGGNS